MSDDGPSWQYREHERVQCNFVIEECARAIEALVHPLMDVDTAAHYYRAATAIRALREGP